MDALGQRIIREQSEIAAKRQRGAALQAEALRLFDEADEQARLLELSRVELPRRHLTSEMRPEPRPMSENNTRET